jgi:tetratricopeptide (TPR) repeat protein
LFDRPKKIRPLRKELARHPRSADFHEQIGNTLWAVEQKEQALDNYSKAAEIRGTSKAYDALARHYVAFGDHTKAAEHTTTAQALRTEEEQRAAADAQRKLDWSTSTAAFNEQVANIRRKIRAQTKRVEPSSENPTYGDNMKTYIWGPAGTVKLYRDLIEVYRTPIDSVERPEDVKGINDELSGVMRRSIDYKFGKVRCSKADKGWRMDKLALHLDAIGQTAEATTVRHQIRDVLKDDRLAAERSEKGKRNKSEAAMRKKIAAHEAKHGKAHHATPPMLEELAKLLEATSSYEFADELKIDIEADQRAAVEVRERAKDILLQIELNAQTGTATGGMAMETF